MFFLSLQESIYTAIDSCLIFFKGYLGFLNTYLYTIKTHPYLVFLLGANWDNSVRNILYLTSEVTEDVNYLHLDEGRKSSKQSGGEKENKISKNLKKKKKDLKKGHHSKLLPLYRNASYLGKKIT